GPGRGVVPGPPALSGSVEPCVDLFLRDRLVEGRVDDDGLCGDLLARVHLLDEVDDLVAEHRVALDDEVELAVVQGLQAVADRVDRDDDDVLARLLARSLDRLDRAETHVVVVGEDQVHVGVGLKGRLDRRLALGAGEVARRLADDLVRADDGVEALLAVDLGTRAERALELEDLGVGVVLLDPLAGHLALEAEVRPDPGDVGVLDRGVDRAVDEHDGDLRVLDLLEDLVPTGLDDRGERDDVDVLVDEVAQGLDLVLLLLLGVHEDQVDAVLLGEARLDGLRVGRAPAGLGAELREADLDEVATATATGRVVTT